MPQSEKEKETLALNLVLVVFALGCVVLAGWTVVVNQFRGGIDDLFLVMVCLLFALVAGISPAMWAYQKGWLKNPLKWRKEAEAPASEEEKVAAR